MNLQEYNRRLQELAQGVSERQVQAIVVPAASRLLGNIKNRIQRQGKATDGADIGTYSSKPFYASKGQFAKKGAFKPVGQRGFKGERIKRVKGKYVKRQKREDWTYKVYKRKVKTMYLQHGYKQLRDIQGRQTQFIDLTYSTDLMASYQLAQESKRVLLGLTSEVQSRKREGLEKRFGAILTGSAKELQEYNEDVQTALKELTIKTITGHA